MIWDVISDPDLFPLPDPSVEKNNGSATLHFNIRSSIVAEKVVIYLEIFIVILCLWDFLVIAFYFGSGMHSGSPVAK